MKKIFLPVLVAFLFSPVFADAAEESLLRQGIFDCNQNGAYAMSVGALGATRGVYVPVADATVELNTGVLVYQQCVLREVINRMREKAMADISKKAVSAIATGRNGNPQHVVREGQELLTSTSDPAFLGFLQDGTLNTLDPSLQGPILRAMKRYYDVTTRSPESGLKCPYAGNLQAYQDGQVRFTAGEFLTASAPQCDPVFALFLAQDLANARVARAIQYQQDEWNWGNGYYAMTDNTLDPLRRRVLTPAITVQQSFQTILDSPVRMAESANDIGQMINAYYSGMTAQMMQRDQGGLAGLTKPFGGGESWIDRVVSEAGKGLREVVDNTAIQNLRSALAVEAKYFKYINDIGTALTTAILQLKSGESQCWDLVIYKNDQKPERHVCAGPLAADNTCTSYAGPCVTNPATGEQTCPTGVPLKVSTSTFGFAQSVVTKSIKAKGDDTLARINTSKKALELIQQLINSVSTGSTDAQRIAAIQFSNLVAKGLVHIPPDVDGPSGVIKESESVQAVMLDPDTGLVATTIKDWANGKPLQPGKGWCNVNEAEVLDAWKKCWDKNNPLQSACPKP